ncbi:unnamed protein product [Kluyveromyces dobzhanskii CBS 2104]|uniref:WGS project CCBQ000000000 data, contig 00102 n=1 Tax=Kluyveromyces dobzhanskii CBS 2104 TaxID=1427455 RepID=A0A0A8L747_9SACH|nr:unnamed protein product [Kluyveromyces dobzhanskii CBS 2104]
MKSLKQTTELQADVIAGSLYGLTSQRRKTDMFDDSDGREDDALLGVLQDDQIKRATELILDLKRGMMEDFNVESQSARVDGKWQGTLRYNRRTREQADKVRVYLEFYYTLIEKYSTPPADSGHNDVDDVYNPLQVIRNRKIRKKYGDKTRDFHLARPPVIAIKDFSERNSKFPWFVDIMEKSNDIIWRTNHWDELRKPDGTLWFHKSHNRKSHASKNSVVSLSSSLDGSSSEASSRKGRFDRRAGASVTSSKSDYRDNRTSKSILSRLSRGSNRRPEPMENIKNNDSKILVPKIVYETPSDYASGKCTIIDVPIDPVRKNEEVPEPPIDTNYQRRSSSSRSESYLHTNSGSFSSNINSGYASNTLANSTTNTNTNTNTDSDPSTPDLKLNVVEEATSKALYDDYQSLKCLQCSWDLLRRKNILTSMAAKKNLKHTSKKLSKDLQSFRGDITVTESILGDFEGELSKNSLVLSEWKSKLLTDYANRVNKLISFSDRFLSDINTTLALRVKILQENIEKVSLISHVQKRAWRKVMYKALEMFIVSSLWVVWLIFSILKIFKIGFAVVFKVVKWALF